MKHLKILLILILLPLFASTQTLNSILNIKLGDTKDITICKIDSIEARYIELNKKILMQYDIDNDYEYNLISLLFNNDTIIQIQIYFYCYELNSIIANCDKNKFKTFLDSLDNIYNSNIRWKGTYKSENVIAKTEKFRVVGGTYIEPKRFRIESGIYDVLIITYR